MKIPFAAREMFDPSAAFARPRMQRVTTTTSSTSSAPQAAPSATAETPIPTTARPESGAVRGHREEREHDPRHAFDAAREAGVRARVRDHEDDDHDDDHENRGAAPGAVRFAQKMVHLVRDEMRSFLREDEALTDEQRDAIKAAGKDLRRELRDAATTFTAEDGSFDLAGFFGSVADSMSTFASRVGEIVGVDDAEEVPTEETEPAPTPVDDTSMSDPAVPTKSVPTPTLDPSLTGV